MIKTAKPNCLASSGLKKRALESGFRDLLRFPSLISQLLARTLQSYWKTNLLITVEQVVWVWDTPLVLAPGTPSWAGKGVISQVKPSGLITSG